MSLINEALKRAEQEKLQTPGKRRAPGDLLPVRRGGNPRRGRQELLALAGLVALVGGLAGWSALKAQSTAEPQEQLASAGDEAVAAAPTESRSPVDVLAARAEAARRRSMTPPKQHRPGVRAAKSGMPRPAAPARYKAAEVGPPATAARRLESAYPSELPAGDETALTPAGISQLSQFKLTGIMEGPEGAVYIRGTAQLNNGQATISLPDHFSYVTSGTGITVNVTPLSAESEGLAVTEKTTSQITVKELRNGTGTYSFDYTVFAVRSGYENFAPVRDKSSVQPASVAPAQAPETIDNDED